MIYAVNVGLIEANPASGIDNAFERPKKQHMPTIRPAEASATAWSETDIKNKQ